MTTEAPQPPKYEGPESGKGKFLNHPVVIVIGLVGALASLIAIPLAFYLYFAGKDHRQLTYYVHPVKATIVRAGQASRLSAAFDDKPIKSEVTAAQVAIWNDGDLPIRRENILKPITILIDGSIPILEATIRKSSREVAQIVLDQHESQEGRITVAWSILERGDGGVIQLIYAGNTKASIKVEGIVEGQTQIERREFKGKIRSPDEQYEAERLAVNTGPGYFILDVALLLIFFGAIGSRAAKETYKSNAQTYRRIIEDHIAFYDGQISYEQKAIATNDEFIANVERRMKEQGDGKDFEWLKKSQLQEIEQYKKEQGNSTETIKGHQAEKIKVKADSEKILAGWAKRKKRTRAAALVAIGFGLIALIPALYLLFVARPVGPPFGF